MARGGAVAHHVDVVVAVATLWVQWSAFLLAPGLGLPAFVGRVAAALMGIEVVALLTWGYGSDGCAARPCATVPELARTLAVYDVPALTAVLVLLVALHPWRARHSRA